MMENTLRKSDEGNKTPVSPSNSDGNRTRPMKMNGIPEKKLTKKSNIDFFKVIFLSSNY